MGKYVFAYKGGGMPESEEEGQKIMQAWMDWMGGLGDAITDQGNPFGPSQSVGNGASAGLTGYTIVSADSLDAAVALAAGCPILNAPDGGVDVYEAMAM